MRSILLKNGRVWDGEQFRFVDILTEDGTISRMEGQICQNADFVIDATGRTVTAGLIDMHAHLKGISSDNIGAQAEMCCFPFGVTSVVDAEGVLGDKKLMDSFLVKSQVFVKVPIKKNEPDFDTVKEKLWIYGERAVGLKVYFDTGISEVLDCSPLEKICNFAEEHHLIVMVHSTNSPTPMCDIVKTLRKGDILTHIFHGGIHNAAEAGYQSLLEAKKKGIALDLGLEGFTHTDYSLFEESVRIGVFPDVISTDLTKVSLNTRGGKYGLPMCMSVAKKAGMSEETVFRAVTSNPSKVLGIEKKCGFLKEGACADIAVLEEMPEGRFELMDMFGHSMQAKKGYQCVLTVAEGQIIYRSSLF